MTIKNIICGPTGLQPWLFDFYMQHALERHPDTHLVTLRRIGAVSLASSVEHFAAQVDSLVGPDEPIMVTGESQGALVVMRYALDHPDRVKHVITIGSPFHGAWISRLLWVFPSAREIVEGTPFLLDLLTRLPQLGGNVTNIFSPSERVMSLKSCYLDPRHAANIIIGSEHQLHDFFNTDHGLEFNQIITCARSVNHLNAMLSPELRSLIWRTVDRVSLEYGFQADGVPDCDLAHQDFILNRFVG
jgi:pimeloyl-ACP methyl ester carboxylesterase